MNPLARRPSGFTLLEVMVALAILAGSFLALSDLAGSAAKNYAYARDLSAATLLAREKMAELEERYEDSGFQDFDETLDGDFGDQGRPDFAWKAQVKKPDSKLSGQQLVAVFLGVSPDDVNTQDLLAKLLGGAPGATAGGTQPTASPAAAPGGALGGLFQTQLTAFGEDIKKSIREVKLTVSWKEGQREQGFDVSTYLVVLNPKAPGGSRGPNPDIPPGVAAASTTQGLLGSGALATPAARAAN